MRIGTGCKELDDLLCGGVENGAITLIYGEAGSGKTNLCLLLTKNAVMNGKKVVYIDSEGVSFERIKQICGEKTDLVLKEIIFREVTSIDEQKDAVLSALKMTESAIIGMVVLDSATTFYRLTLAKSDDDSGKFSFTYQMTSLLSIARKRRIPVVVTTQVYTNQRKNQYEPIGGHFLNHIAKCIIRLEKIGRNMRRAVIIKHRYKGELESMDFVITNEGIKALCMSDSFDSEYRKDRKSF